jgi:hypothetical protein
MKEERGKKKGEGWRMEGEGVRVASRRFDAASSHSHHGAHGDHGEVLLGERG